MSERLLRVVVWSVLTAGAAVSFGCAARTYPLVGDVQLALRVKTAILNDAVVGTQPVDVRATGSTVTLNGQVRSTDDIDRLIAVVRAVPGVTDVVSNLTVAPPGTPVLIPTTAAPPRERRRGFVGVGAGIRTTPITAASLGTTANIFPIVRLPPGDGIGPAIGFSWMDLPIETSPAGTPALGVLKLRPLMFGLSWSRTMGRSSVSASAVGGWSFNHVGADPSAAGPFRAIDSSGSFVWRPGVSAWHELDDRFGINLFVGGLFARPRVTFASDEAVTETHLKTRALIVRVGLAYWVF